MRFFTKRLTLLAVLLWAVAGAKAQSIEFEVDGIWYLIFESSSEDKSVKVIRDLYEGDIVIPETVAYEGETYAVTQIGAWAFTDCMNLRSVTIPNSVTVIGDRAFGGCIGLTTVEIPASVTSISGDVFSACTNLASIEVDEGNTVYTSIDGVLYSKDKKTLCCVPPKSTFQGIPDFVTVIGEFAFSYCTDLTSLEIPSTVESIGRCAFVECSGLTSLKIPSSVVSIGDCAFQGCSGLTFLDIPSSVVSIGDYAFEGCDSLTSVKLPPALKTLGDFAFPYSNLDSIVLPHSLETWGRISSSSSSMGVPRMVYICLFENENVINALNTASFNARRTTVYGTAEILEKVSLIGATKELLFDITDVKKEEGTLSFAVTDVVPFMQIRALEIAGQRVEANESSVYRFDGMPEGSEHELVIYADINGVEYPVHLTVTAAGGGVAIHSVADEGTDGLQAEVGGNLSDGTARLRVAGDGGEARWTLTEVGGAMVAQGCARADGSWQRIEGVYASRGIYLLMVSDGQVAKTIKLVAR